MFAISFQYLKENTKDEVDFLRPDKQKFLQTDTIILGVVDQACSYYPKQQICYFFAISFKRSEWWSWFLHRKEHEGFLQINTMVLIGMIKHSQSFQNSKFAMPLQYLKQKVRDKVDFLLADKHQLISTLLASKFPSRFPYWWAWSSILKVLEVTNLQYLYNISRKKLGWRVHVLHADKHQSFYKLALSLLMEKARHAQST